MREILLAVGGPGSGAIALLVAAALLLLAALIGIAVLIARASRARSLEAARQTGRAEGMDALMAEVAGIQADTAGRIHMMGEALGGRQAELSRVLAERLDAVTHRIGQSMETTTRHTVESLRHLHERLAVIDNAQKNLTDLSSQVTSLREVLANKQARGAFGQGRMEAIVRDGLPKGPFEVQFTLSDRAPPDCVVFPPAAQRPIVIDATFPLSP